MIKLLWYSGFCLFLYLIPVLSLAQGMNNEEIVSKTQALSVFKAPSEKLQGSPYINDEYLPASLSNSKKIYSVKYNAYLDQMEILTGGDEVRALPVFFGYTIEFIGINKKYRVFSNEDGKNGFFVVLNEGEKVTLLAKEIVLFFEESYPKTGYNKYEPPSLKRLKDRYYIGFKNNTSTLVPVKKNEFYDKFGKESDEIKAFVKSHKLSIKNEQDLIQIFSYYNSL